MLLQNPTELAPMASLTPRPGELELNDGMRLRVWHWPQQAGRPSLHWAHATGFHGRLYAPMLNQLAQHFNVMAWDMRGHGESVMPATRGFRSWNDYYEDLCQLLDLQDEAVFLGGHSVGGTTSLVAAARRPDKVRGLVLADPVLLSGWHAFGFGFSKWMRRAQKISMAQAAARRRSKFESRQQAFDRYKGRGAFRTWPDNWLQAYVDHGFRNVDDGVELACEPAWESASFAHTEHRVWSKIKGLRKPTIALGAETGGWLTGASGPRLEKSAPQCEVRIVPGSSHFLPMEQPQIVIDALLELLQRQS